MKQVINHPFLLQAEDQPLPICNQAMVIFAMLMLAAASALIAWSGENVDLFYTLNDAVAVLPDALWANLTLVADTLFAVAVLLAVASRRPTLLSYSLILLILGSVVVHSGKAFFDLPRPPAVLPLDTFQVIGPALKNHSFPSGHSFTAFAWAGLLMLTVAARWGALLMLIAALAAFSRIAVGAHWPLDVTTGSALGLLVALASVHLCHRVHLLRNKWVTLVAATLMTLASAWLPFFEDRYPDTGLLAFIAGTTALLCALAWFWRPLLDGKNRPL